MTPIPQKTPFDTSPIPITIPAALRELYFAYYDVYSIFFSAGTVTFHSLMAENFRVF